jgi:RimJ/RimL family protein N-acetyltransferase
MAIMMPKDGEERIELRPAKLYHARPMSELIDPATAPNLEFCSEPVTYERQLAYLKRMKESPTDFLFTVMLKNNHWIIGAIGLHEHDRFNRTARLGRWIFNPADRNKGYGSEAVFHLLQFYAFNKIDETDPEANAMGFPLHKIYVNLFTENISAKQYFEKLGFKEECVLKKEYLLRGEYHDMMRLSLFREEWGKIMKEQKR